jgi:hypothetical protein
MESIKCRKVAPNEEANTGQIGLKLLEDHTGTDSNENDSGEDGEGSLQRSPKAHLKPPPARKRFSMYLISATITSTIFLLVSIALLSFLWRSSDSNTAWRVIVLANWTTRMVTLSALALRIAVSVQAGIATSMLASLIIEGTGIRIINAPEVSAIRFSNSGPHTLFWIYAKQASSCALLMLLTILTISTIATQFSSTILLSDFELISILGPPSNSWMAYGFDPTSFEGSELNLYKGIYGTDYSAHLLTEYPSFGEYSIPLERKDEIDDTGTVIRSMIPIADKDTRERLRHYRGKAFAFDARTVCIQPKIFSMQNCGFSASNDIQLPVRLCGKVAPRHTADNAVFNMNGTQFECDLPLKPSRCGVPGAADEHCTAWTLCRLRPVAAGGLISALDPTNNASVQPSWYPIDPVESEPEDPELGIWAASNGNTSWPVDLGNAFLVLNASMEQFITQNETIDSTYVGIGPWAEFKIPPDMSYLGSSFESFRVSLCYDALYELPFLFSSVQN